MNYNDELYREKIKKGRAKIRGFKDIDDFILSNVFEDSDILELGCGEFSYFKNSFKVDIAPSDQIDLIHDLNDPIEIRKRKFDVILAIEVIEHLWNVDDFLKSCYNLLRGDGIMIISTPNVLYWRNRLQLLIGDDSWFNNNGEHLWYFSPRSFRKKVEEHNFEIMEMKPIGLTKILTLCGGFVVMLRKKMS